jgi:hypothetical protein
MWREWEVSRSEHEAQLRQQIFLFAIGIFLVAYLIGLYRSRSFEWAMLTSSVAFGITIGAGALLAAVVKLQDDAPAADGGQESGTGATDNVVDFRSGAHEFDAQEQAAD